MLVGMRGNARYASYALYASYGPATCRMIFVNIGCARLFGKATPNNLLCVAFVFCVFLRVATEFLI